MIKTRRSLLKNIGIGLAFMQLPNYAWGDTAKKASSKTAEKIATPNDIFAICDDSGAPQIYSQLDSVPASKGFVKIWAYGTESEDVFEIPFSAHSLIQNPLKPSELCAFSKWSNQAALINLKDKLATRIFTEEKNHRFFGHGLYSKDGKKIFCSQVNDETHAGEIVVRDSESFKVLERFSAYGRYPYELHYGSDSEIMIAVSAAFKDSNFAKISKPNFSEQTSLTTIKSTDGTFVKRVVLPESLYSLMHFQITSDGWKIGVGSANEKDTSEKKSFAVSISPAGKLAFLETPDDFKGDFNGETLGISLFEKKSIAFLTNPSNKLILIWNYKTNEVVKYFYIPDRPKAIAMTSDLKTILVAETKTKDFLLIDSKTMEISGRTTGHELSGYGSHVLRLKNW